MAVPGTLTRVLEVARQLQAAADTHKAAITEAAAAAAVVIEPSLPPPPPA
jgi:hypothetical protein